MGSLRFRILGTYSAVIVIVLVLFNTTPIFTTQRLIVDTKANELLKTANMVSSSLSSLQLLDAERVGSVMAILNVSGDVRMLVTDHRGYVVYDNSDELSVTGKALVLSEVFSALDGMDAFRCTYKNSVFESVAAVPVMFKGELLGTVCFF